MVLKSPLESAANSTLTPLELPKQLDLAQVCIYGLSILSAGIFLFMPLFNLLNPSPWHRQLIHTM
jgi:hypothetical protein